MVEAVPMVMQWPALLDMQTSASTKSSPDILPARYSSTNFQVSVPEPISLPLNFPFSIGPPVIINAGKSTLAVPMSKPGVVLSQPESKITPSKGLALNNSSVSIANIFR